MRAKVYAIPGSHPVRAGLLMLEHKGIKARRRDLPNVLVRPLLRAMGFPGKTVPAVRLEDGTRIQTTRGLARKLDELVPERPLFPAAPARRARVEEAERWGDEVLQPVPRRISYSSPIRKGPARKDLASFFEGHLLGLPPRLAVATAGPLLALGARLNAAGDDAVRADLLSLPALLDQVDDLISNGVIGGAEPNAADFQIFPTVRLLMAFEDLKPIVAGRPAAEHALRVVPYYPGSVRAALPDEWLAPLRS